MAKRALVVDDVAFARKVIIEVLTAAKYIVVGEAANGEEAVRAFKEHVPDFVTMDVVMPKMGGIEATRSIVDYEKSAKIIIVSAMAHEHLLMDAINAGARDYILKPFTKEDLLKSVAKLFQDEAEGRKSKQSSSKGANL